MPYLRGIRCAWSMCFVLAAMCALVCATSSLANASATLLLEEPYGKLGFFTATGHAAVYLSGVCAETPVVLRTCAPGELGVVISRYDGVGGYDWLAIPLIPYLYAVDRPEDVPLFADPKMVTFLRDQYRRKYLTAIVPDLSSGEAPGGNWYELVGSAYDRASYAFEIETSAAQDEAFIRKYNAAPNRSHFRTVSSNCADFAKDVINFYYPKALHRSVVADVGITTPKQMAKTMVKFSARHPELQSTRFVMPQVPGVEARSAKVHGVVESFLKSKKYIVPSAIVSPIFAGCVAAVYLGTSAGHFDPARDALVYSAQRPLEKPLAAEDRRYYQRELNRLVERRSVTERLMAENTSDTSGARQEKEKLSRVLGNAFPHIDAGGHPVLRMVIGGEVVSVGVTESNILANDVLSANFGKFQEQLLEKRLQEELRRGAPPKVSESDVARDWQLLQRAMNESDDQMAARSAKLTQPGSQARIEGTGNRP
jgi:hypothetical protein